MTSDFAVSLSVPAVIHARRETQSLRNGFTIAAMLMFLALRVATSGPPTALDPVTSIGSQTAQQNLPMTLIGVALVMALIATEPAMAFVFILCDMNGFGAFFDLDQWGIAGAFKFRDLEMGILLAVAALLWLARPAHVEERRTRLGNYLGRVALIITATALVYTLATLRFQDLATTVRYSRQLYVWLLLLAGPQFIRTPRDLKRAVVFLVAYVALCAGLYIGQAVSPPQTILRYSQQMITGHQTRVWATSMSAVLIGGMAMFAYQLQMRRSRLALWIIFAACSVAIVMSQGRMLTAIFALSIGMMILHRAIVTRRIGLAMRVAATAVIVLLVCVAMLWLANRLDPLLDVWTGRMGELELDVQGHQGSLSSRAAMFEYLPLVVERNGGGLLASWFGMGLRALTPMDLAPMTFWGEISPPIWADNGLAGVTFTFGYFGLALLVVFVATMILRLKAQFARAEDPLCRSITFAAAVYFAWALPLMYFSGAFMGVWDDALAVVAMLIIAERSAAIRLPWRIMPANGLARLPEIASYGHLASGTRH